MINRFTGPHTFLSNFHPSPITIEGITYPTAEHAYQAQKTVSHEERLKVARAKTPGAAKRAGRKVIMSPGFYYTRVEAMLYVLRAKFDQNTYQRTQLIDTWPHDLFEGNTWNDTFWGISLATGKGQNHLGKALMQLRAEYQSTTRSVCGWV